MLLVFIGELASERIRTMILAEPALIFASLLEALAALEVSSSA